jgi:uncharacterized membrane protein
MRIPPLETPLDAVLWIHILTGVAGLALGAGALLAKKGSPRHVRFGRFYLGSQVLANGSAMPVALYSFNSFFLFYLAIYVLYLCFSGWRAIGRQKPGTRGAWVDWLALAGLGGVIVGLWSCRQTAGGSGTASAVFAGLCAAHAAWEVFELTAPPTMPRFWWLSHMGRMTGSYIGSLTAVFVVQAPIWVSTEMRYLGPPLVLVPLLWLWLGCYFVKFRRHPIRARSAAATAGAR